MTSVKCCLETIDSNFVMYSVLTLWHATTKPGLWSPDVSTWRYSGGACKFQPERHLKYRLLNLCTLKTRWKTVATAHMWDSISKALAENAETLANKNSILKDVKWNRWSLRIRLGKQPGWRFLSILWGSALRTCSLYPGNRMNGVNHGLWI